MKKKITLDGPGLYRCPVLDHGILRRLLEDLTEDSDCEIEVAADTGGFLSLLGDLGGKEDFGGLLTLHARGLTADLLNTRMTTMILGIDSPARANDVKLSLMKVYPQKLLVYILKGGQDGIIKFRPTSLKNLDKPHDYDHNTGLYILPVDLTRLENFSFADLVKITEILRSPGGCPWDREQTHLSLRQCLLEETYEALEALDLEDKDKIVEEMGDVLLQVVFHGQIGKEHDKFDINEIISGVCRKMIERHPHIFGDIKVKNSDEVLVNWEKIKKREKGLETQTQILRDIPPVLPALMRAFKVQKKAAAVGFDWDCVHEALKKLEEELEELKDAFKDQDKASIDEETGDLLFSVVNVARFLKVEPELALKAAIEKFIRRFEYMENTAPRPLREMPLEEMDSLWNKAKGAFLGDFHV